MWRTRSTRPYPQMSKSSLQTLSPKSDFSEIPARSLVDPSTLLLIISVLCTEEAISLVNRYQAHLFSPDGARVQACRRVCWFACRLLIGLICSRSWPNQEDLILLVLPLSTSSASCSYLARPGGMRIAVRCRWLSEMSSAVGVVLFNRFFLPPPSICVKRKGLEVGEQVKIKVVKDFRKRKKGLAAEVGYSVYFYCVCVAGSGSGGGSLRPDGCVWLQLHKDGCSSHGYNGFLPPNHINGAFTASDRFVPIHLCSNLLLCGFCPHMKSLILIFILVYRWYLIQIITLNGCLNKPVKVVYALSPITSRKGFDQTGDKMASLGPSTIIGVDVPPMASPTELLSTARVAAIQESN